MSDIDWTPVEKSITKEIERLEKRRVNAMNDKVCENCKWFKHHDDYKYNGNCCRYPKWMLVSINHYCGEWKERNDD